MIPQSKFRKLMHNVINRIAQKRLIGFSIFFLQRSSELRLNQVAASLSFTTLLALVPFFTVTFIVISAFPMFSEITIKFHNFLTDTLMPEYASKVISTYMQEFTAKAGNLTALGVTVLVCSSVLLVMTIERTFNQIWRTKQRRAWVTRILVYWSILTLGPLILGTGLSIWSWLFRETNFPIEYPIFGYVVRIAGSVSLSTFLLWALYRFVPHRYVPNSHAIIGAFMTAVLLEIVRRVFGLYISNFANYQLIYGAFAVLPVFLFWLFCLWYVLLGGAVLTASFSYWKGNAFLNATDSRGRFDDVLKVMILLYHAQHKGRAVSIREFRRRVNMGYDELGDLLDSLASENYIALEKKGWILKTSAQEIMLSTLFKMFVYEPRIEESSAVSQGISTLLSDSINSLDISLDSFARKYD